MTELDFGIFKEFWNGHPNHLPFLGLHDDNNNPPEWNLNESLERLDFICDKNSSELILKGIYKLLKHENWRLHLIAILVSLKLSRNLQQEIIPCFWARLEKGSWISPQILSVLSIIDDDFEFKATQILDNGLNVHYSTINMMDHYSARGPEGSKEASEKVINSIKSLLKYENDEFD